MTGHDTAGLPPEVPGTAAGGEHTPSSSRDELAVVAAALVRRLPQELPDTLTLNRFADARTALERLADPVWLNRAVAACTPGEAARLVTVIGERWTALLGDSAQTPRGGR